MSPPPLLILRDTLQPQESLAAYIDRQLQLMHQHFESWRQAQREASVPSAGSVRRRFSGATD